MLILNSFSRSVVSGHFARFLSLKLSNDPCLLAQVHPRCSRFFLVSPSHGFCLWSFGWYCLFFLSYNVLILLTSSIWTAQKSTRFHVKQTPKALTISTSPEDTLSPSLNSSCELLRRNRVTRRSKGRHRSRRSRNEKKNRTPPAQTWLGRNKRWRIRG